MRKSDAERCRTILLMQRKSILENATRVRQGELELDQDDFPDEMDMALAEASLSFAGRIRERESKLLRAYPKTPAAFHVMMAQAKWSIA